MTDQVYVGGSIEDGLIIEAHMPKHLGGGKRGMVLTPSASRELVAKLAALNVAGGPVEQMLLPSGYSVIENCRFVDAEEEIHSFHPQQEPDEPHQP